jgi:hypothetical protein
VTTNFELWERVPDELKKLAYEDRDRLFPMVWHWIKYRGDRKGHRCRVLAQGQRGGPWNVLVEFMDGELVVAPQHAVREARSG